MFSFCRVLWDSMRDVVILAITSIVLCRCRNSDCWTLFPNAIVFTQLTWRIKIQLWWNTNYSILNWMKIEHKEWRTRNTHRQLQSYFGSLIGANRCMIFLQLLYHKINKNNFCFSLVLLLVHLVFLPFILAHRTLYFLAFLRKIYYYLI